MFKVIQMGMGGWGDVWLRAVKASPVVDFVGFVEVSKTIGPEQTAKYGFDDVPVFDTLDEALQATDPDAILDITPPRFRKANAFKALEAGLPIMAEKPLAETMEDAQAIVDKSNETSVLYMVAQNYRYSPPIQTLKQVLGKMGQIAYIHVEFYRDVRIEGFRKTMPYPLIIDMSIHHFDLMRFFLESEPVSVYGRSWNPPWSNFEHDASAAVSFKFGAGEVVSYHGSWASLGHMTNWNGYWRFDCEKGVVTMIEDEVVVDYAGDEQRTTVVPVQMERTAQDYMLHEFYEAVTQGKASVTTCQDNINSLAMVFNAIRSFEAGVPVK